MERHKAGKDEPAMLNLLEPHGWWNRLLQCLRL